MEEDPGARAHGLPLYRCQEDNGVPRRLVGEVDVLCLPAAEELHFEAEGGGYPGASAPPAPHSGTRVRLTSHRLLWQEGLGAAAAGTGSTSPWVAVRLDQLLAAEAFDRFLRSRRCLLRFRAGSSLLLRRGDGNRIDELIHELQKSLKASKWKEGSYDPASIGGLRRILERRDAQQRARNDTFDVALGDLESLRQHAAQTVAAARQVAANLKASDDKSCDGMQKLLEDFGLLNVDGTPVAKGGSRASEVDSDVARVCQAALSKRGQLGLLLAHDVFCLVNRARGTALLSPEEVMAALRRCAQPGGPLRLRALGSIGALAVSLSQTSDKEVDEQLASMAAESPVSAFSLAQKLGLTTSEAQYLLSDAEARAAVVRDDAPEGVFYYPNFFNDY